MPAPPKAWLVRLVSGGDAAGRHFIVAATDPERAKAVLRRHGAEAAGARLVVCGEAPRQLVLFIGAAPGHVFRLSRCFDAD